ncbi:MAG: helix-turn-helix transcriptional regulator [Alloprevotella sp.]|nr:helix-turn-helix transcriptional regulator [Alloprevotella sp.]
MNRIKQMLSAKGATQGEAAKLLGLSQTSFSLKANGKNCFTQSEIRKLAEHYKLSPQEVVDVFLREENHERIGEADCGAGAV